MAAAAAAVAALPVAPAPAAGGGGTGRPCLRMQEQRTAGTRCARIMPVISGPARDITVDRQSIAACWSSSFCEV